MPAPMTIFEVSQNSFIFSHNRAPSVQKGPEHHISYTPQLDGLYSSANPLNQTLQNGTDCPQNNKGL